MREYLPLFILIAGMGQLLILFASALVPIQLEWKQRLAELPRLVRQLFWVYGGYVVITIIAQGVLAIAMSETLASGTPLARMVCGYSAVFWGVRLALQAWLDVKIFLTNLWLKLGYHILTAGFVYLTIVYAWAAMG